MVRSTAVALVCGFLLASCGSIPNDYASATYNSTVKSSVKHSLPRTVLTPRGTLLVVPNYSTGSTQAVIRIQGE